MTNRAKLVRLPMVIAHLRRGAGFKSQSAAARAIRKQTGVRLNKAQLSHWERGQAMPSLASLLTFLEGLGYSLQDFQDELDRANGVEVPGPAPAPDPTPVAAPIPVAEPTPAAPAAESAPAVPAAEPAPAVPAAEAKAPEPDLVRRVEALEQRLRALGDSDFR